MYILQPLKTRVSFLKPFFVGNSFENWVLILKKPTRLHAQNRDQNRKEFKQFLGMNFVRLFEPEKELYRTHV